MKTTVSILVILLVLTGFIFGEKVAVLTELTNPSSFTHPMHIDGNQIFITDGIKMFIYSAENFKLINKFGKPGEGPGEFIGSDGGQAITAAITPKDIVVSSVNKISYFTKDGNFIRERKTSNDFMFVPFGDKFTGNRFIIEDQKEFIGLYLLDANLKSIKKLARTSQFSLRTSFSPFFVYRAKPLVYKEKLYISHPVSGMIDIYNQDAEKLKSLTHKFEKIKITEAEKETMLGFYRDDVRLKPYYSQVKRLITFPIHFPAVKTFHISDGKIYILTYKRVEGNSEFVILDLRGNLVKKVMFPLSHVSFLETCPYTVFNGKIYQLIFDEDLDAWELHIDELK